MSQYEKHHHTGDPERVSLLYLERNPDGARRFLFKESVKQGIIDATGKNLAIYDRLAVIMVNAEKENITFDPIKMAKDLSFGESPENDSRLIEKNIQKYVSDQEGSAIFNSVDIDKLASALGSEASYYETLLNMSINGQNFTADNKRELIDFLIEEQDNLIYPPEYYIKSIADERIPSSQVNNLINASLGESTGFFDPETRTKKNTINDYIAQKNLKQIDIVSNRSIEFLSTLKGAVCKTLFERKLTAMNDGQKPKSLLSTEVKDKIRNGVYPFKLTIDGLYEVGEQVVLVDFNMPRQFNTDKKSAERYHSLSDTAATKMNLLQEAVKAAIGKYPDRSVVFYAGVRGLFDRAKSLTSENKDEMIEDAKQLASSDSLLIKEVSYEVEPNPTYIRKNLIPSVLNIYKENIVGNKPLQEIEASPKQISNSSNPELVGQMARYNFLGELIKKFEEQRKALALDVKGLMKELGIKPKTETATIVERKGKHTIDHLLAVASDAGLDIPKEVYVEKITHSTKIDPTKLSLFCKNNGIDLGTLVPKQTTIQSRRDHEYKMSCGQDIKSAVDTAVSSTKQMFERKTSSIQTDAKEEISAKEAGYSF